MPADDLIKTQPISSVEWVDPTELQANNYNPNHVAKPEMALLKTSIMEDGWTQPIVALETGEIVDGFHRWTLISTDSEVQEITGGLVPVVRIAPDPAQQRMATIRHNRARGAHQVLKMADIVGELVELGLEPAEIAQRVGMDMEEVNRMIFRGDKIRNAEDEFTESWRPAPTQRHHKPA